MGRTGFPGSPPPAIDDYAFVSDSQSAALISREGSVDWWCVPRFDSPSVFGRLLGAEAGHWALHPSAAFETTREYVADTLVLRTVFTTAGGEVAVSDALAFAKGARGHEIGLRSPHVLVRRVDGMRGSVEILTEVAPRMEYGLTVPHVTEAQDGSIVARGGPVRLRLTASVALSASPGWSPGASRSVPGIGSTCGWPTRPRRRFRARTTSLSRWRTQSPPGSRGPGFTRATRAVTGPRCAAARSCCRG
jgi:hypothetical protein